MELFAIKVSCFQLYAIFVERSILDTWQGSDYATALF